MRGKGLLLIVLVVVAVSAYSQFAAAGGRSVETTVVPSAPVTVACRVTGGHTVVSISAIDSVDNVSASIGGEVSVLADHLDRGWSVSRSVSGAYQSVVVYLDWRGAKQQVPVVCK